MEIHTEIRQGVTLVEIPMSELDASNVGHLKKAMTGILENSLKVVIDFHRTQFIDSSGLGAILSFLRQVSARGGDLKLCGLTKQVRATFELVRMHRVFDIFDNQEDAVGAFRAA